MDKDVLLSREFLKNVADRINRIQNPLDKECASTIYKYLERTPQERCELVKLDEEKVAKYYYEEYILQCLGTPALSSAKFDPWDKLPKGDKMREAFVFVANKFCQKFGTHPAHGLNLQLGQLIKIQCHQGILGYKVKIFSNDTDFIESVWFKDLHTMVVWAISRSLPPAQPNMTPQEWFLTPNPLLGGVIPVEMIKQGKSEKLCKFILNQLDENGMKTPAQRCELRKLDEKTLENFLDEYSTENPDFNHIKGLSKEICQKFATPTAQKTNQSLDHMFEKAILPLSNDGIKGNYVYLRDLYNAMEVYLEEYQVAQRSLSLEEIEQIILDWSYSDNQEHGSWGPKEIARNAARAIKAKLGENVPVHKTLSLEEISRVIVDTSKVYLGHDEVIKLATAIKAKMDADEQHNEGATK